MLFKDHPSMWARWRYLANMIELVHPSALHIDHSLQTKTTNRSFSHFCTDHGRVSPDTFLGPVWVHNPNGITIGRAVFFAQMTTVSLYLTMGRPSLPPNCPLPHGRLLTPSNTWLLGPTRVSSTHMESRSAEPFWHSSLVWQTVLLGW